ncbi:MAG TPA: tagaturonate epimerase family protein [Bacteroidaceae bacterium]|nr:tagaturonate epimerase family protein [Bacteroidaceae bacterium]
MKLDKYSIGIGDRFSHQGEAQLQALINGSKKLGYNFVPVWNKSNREHEIVGSSPNETRIEADSSVKALKYNKQYFVDADHINMSNVDKFIDSSDFFTIDVADYIGKECDKKSLHEYINKNSKYIGKLQLPGIEHPFDISRSLLEQIGNRYLYAAAQAGKIYNHIVSKKGENNFITEVSMDEVDNPQTPIELFFILSALSIYGVPAQTIAPKFSGRFNKGVEYVGNIEQFAIEFEQDLLVIDFAIKEFGLPNNLKLSIHSGSDKFVIYPIIGNLIRKYNKGIHVKTAGTTWLEEIIGLALSDNKSLELVKKIYSIAFDRIEELCEPYKTVIDIDRDKLPSVTDIMKMSGDIFARTLRHDQSDPKYNPHFRQLIHVSYKIAAELKEEFIPALKRNKDVVGAQVIENLYNRHIMRLFS